MGFSRTQEDILLRRQYYRNLSQSSDERTLSFGDSREYLDQEFATESESYIDEDFDGAQIRRRSSQRRQRADGDQHMVGGSWLVILKKLGVLMELVSRMPLPPASVGGIAGATLLLTFLGPRALVQSLVYPVYRHGLGALYPAYSSYKAVRSKNVREYVKWMMYWIVFALYSCLETVADVFVSWIPFYYEAKVLIVLWLLSPTTKGSSIIYKKFLHPALTRREQEIDDVISKARDRGYHTVLQLGSKGVNYATNVIVQTAMKSSGALTHQLRKTHSLSDIPETDQPPQWPAIDDVTEEGALEGSADKGGRLMTRKRTDAIRQRPRPVSYTEEEVPEKSGGYKISRKTSDESTSSGYSSSAFTEPGTPKKKEDSGRTRETGFKSSARKTPATISEDSELYMENSSEDISPCANFNQQYLSKLYTPLNLIFNRTVDDTPTKNDKTSYHYQNVTITDITNEVAKKLPESSAEAKKPDSDAKVEKTDAKDLILNEEQKQSNARTKSSVLSDLDKSNISQSQIICQQNLMKVIEGLNKTFTNTNLDPSTEQISHKSEEKLAYTNVDQNQDIKFDQSADQIIKKSNQDSVPQNILNLVDNNTDTEISKVHKRNSFDGEKFFDVSTDSLEEFEDCENIVSGNISIKITQDAAKIEEEQCLKISSENLSADLMNIRHQSLTPSTGSSNGSIENITSGNLRISPSKKIYVSGKRKAPEPPPATKLSDSIEKSGESSKPADAKNAEGLAADKSKKKSSSPSAMSKLMNFPGKILPFLAKSDGENAKISKDTEIDRKEKCELKVEKVAEQGSSRSLPRSNSEVDLENKLKELSESKTPQRITETDV